MTRREIQKPAPRVRLTAQQSIQLAADAVVALSTVYRWAKGGEVHGTTALRLQRAAAKMGVMVPA